MAKVTVVPPVPAHPTVKVELTLDEAQRLYAILGPTQTGSVGDLHWVLMNALKGQPGKYRDTRDKDTGNLTVVKVDDSAW